VYTPLYDCVYLLGCLVCLSIVQIQRLDDALLNENFLWWNILAVCNGGRKFKLVPVLFFWNLVVRDCSATQVWVPCIHEKPFSVAPPHSVANPPPHADTQRSEPHSPRWRCCKYRLRVSYFYQVESPCQLRVSVSESVRRHIQVGYSAFK
jgi:hypothetical protein